MIAARLVGADRQRGEVDRAEALADLARSRRSSRCRRRGRSAASGPRRPSRPRGGGCDRRGGGRRSAAPARSDPSRGRSSRSATSRARPRRAAGVAHEARRCRAARRSGTPRVARRRDRRQVGVVVVVVREQHEVDAAAARSSGTPGGDETLRAGERHRARALREHRVGEEGDAVHAHQNVAWPIHVSAGSCASASAIERDDGCGPRPGTQARAHAPPQEGQRGAGVTPLGPARPRVARGLGRRPLSGPPARFAAPPSCRA